MLDILAESPLLTLFIVVTVGAILGAIPFGKVRLGAAGALFIGLALSASNPSLGEGMAIVQSLGLSLFVYTVGVSAGAAFFSQIRQQLSLMTTAFICAGVGAVVTILMAHLLDVPKALATGLYTGALTAAPALDTATRIAGSEEPSVGYAFGYPIGVIVGILLVSSIVGRTWRGEKDTPSLAGQGLTAISVEVNRHVNLRDIPEWRTQKIRVSYLQRGDITRVAIPGEDLEKDDRIVMVGTSDNVEAAAKRVGTRLPTHLADNRRNVRFERIVVSNPDVACHTIAELNLPARYGALVTRVRRGDLDLLASDDFALQMGDRVAVVMPRDQQNAIQDLFGDSERRVSEVDALGLGMGLVLGMLLGLVSFPMPGGSTFSLGPAAGPLIVGMMLGALRRTGPIIWSLPEAANLTIRQLGLLLFLAGLGLTAGPKFATILMSPLAWKAGALAAVVAIVACTGVLVSGKWIIKLSAPRTAGGIAGFLGQPAVLEAAESKVADERISSAYAALFAFSIVVKIILVPLIWSL
ncbi:transporter [Arcanobacterium haemolyticum]|nr:transporter [Arcanobacterium haemolyticum]